MFHTGKNGIRMTCPRSNKVFLSKVFLCGCNEYTPWGNTVYAGKCNAVILC